jgi:hypothetical protein
VIFHKERPAHNLPLSQVYAAGGMIKDPALEALAKEIPVLAQQLTDRGDQVRLKEVYEILSSRPEATDMRHGTVAKPALTRLKEIVSRLFSSPPAYIRRGDAVPVALPFTLSRGSGKGRPYVLRRECPEVCEHLYRAELDHRAAEEGRRIVQASGWRPRPLPSLQRSPDDPPQPSVYELLGIEEEYDDIDPLG